MGVTRADHLLTERATITSRNPTGARDGDGNVITVNASRTTDCYHEQTARDEQDPVVGQTWNLFLPADDPLTASDSVTIDGVAFEVIGAPWQTYNPRTLQNGLVEATLRRTDG